jgi:hypothetical protein
MKFTFDDAQPYSLPPLPPVRKLVAHALVWAGLLVLCVWLAGRICSDRFFITQFASWLPSIAIAGFAACCVAGHWLLTRKHAWPLGKGRVVAMRVLLALALAHSTWELRPHRYLLPVSASVPRENTLRVLHWNVSQTKNPALAGILAPFDADVLLLANPPFVPPVSALRDELAALPTSPGVPAPTHLIQGGRLAMLSRQRVLRWASTQLRVEGSPARAFSWPGGGMVSIDQGEALVLELDTFARLGRSTVIWFVDLPSEPTIARSSMMRRARERLSAPDLQIVSLVDSVAMVPASPAPGTEAHKIRARLANPDLVMGDMNTPRGSASLRLLAPAATDAFSQAGRGWERTFPGFFPVLAINNALVGPDLVCTHYRVHPTGLTRHRAQVIELERAEK